MHAECNVPCEENPDQYGQCKCLSTYFGPQCAQCPFGEQFYGDTFGCTDGLMGQCDDAMKDDCRQHCANDPHIFGDCKCINSGTRGMHCVECPPGHVFAPNSGNCVKNDEDECTAMEAQCNEQCETNGGVCKCVITGWGPQCIHCPEG